MTKTLTNAMLISAGTALLKQAAASRIPYAAGGMSLDGMDCQGLVEYLLTQCGIPGGQCQLAGSNAHWRYSLKWRGTPEEAVEQFGCVPGGAAVFILAMDGGETARGYHDALGNASHMGLRLDGSVIHASSSRGCVAESVFNDATIPNGGWNRVGLLKWVDYGTAWEAQGAPGALADAANSADSGELDGDSVRLENPPSSTGAADSASPLAGLSAGSPLSAAYATVTSPNGGPVKLRKSASQLERVYWEVNPGARVRVERRHQNWSLVTAVCSDGNLRRAYMLNAFLAG